MAEQKSLPRQKLKRGPMLLGSRIARLIFASNLAGLAILIVGAMVLNEMRAGLVVARKQALSSQAQVISSLLAEGATVGQPEPALDEGLARATLRSLDMPQNVRAKIYGQDGTLVGDSFFLSDRVDVSALPPIRDPSQMQKFGAGLSNWAVGVFGTLIQNRGGNAIRTQTFEEEYQIAFEGGDAASQRFSDRGQRIISVSVPVQRVSAVVGVLTLEASDVEEIVRAERAALIPFIGVALLVALITTALLTLGIARPLRRLAVAADRVRTGSSERLDLPGLTKRKDEIGQLAQSVEAMTNALFERIVANESFAADVAHEMKNPLTSIRTAVETAEHVQEDPVAREKLRRLIAKDVERLDRLITDISNASRIEAEIARIPTEQIRIAKLLTDIISTYQATHEAGQTSVRFVDRTMGAGLLVRGRRGPFGQVIRNLLDNARSFSPDDAEVIVTLAQGADGSQTMAVITVEDGGPGIPADKLETIFDRFYTDRPDGTAFGNNSGLGLSIVRQIISTHRGEVHAGNREDGGACFTIRVPAT